MPLKITIIGIILALKNLGTWLATVSFTDVRNDPAAFLWLFLIYCMINIPSDLYLANHLTQQGAQAVREKQEETSTDG